MTGTSTLLLVLTLLLACAEDEEMKTDGANDKVTIMSIDAGSRPANAGPLLRKRGRASHRDTLSQSQTLLSAVRVVTCLSARLICKATFI